MAERLTDHSDRVRQLFDAKAFTWSQKYASGGRLTSRMARISAAVKGHVQAGGSVLDLGCGTGDIARTLAAAGMQLTGCDISSEMLCRASEQDVRDAVNWVQLNTGWRTLPFRTAIFDAIVAVSVLEYVENPHAVLWECARVLRPGGILVCTVPDPAHPVRWLEWVIGLSADAPRIAATANSWPRLGNYLAYLRISRNRHSAGWWTAAAAQCHLQDISSPTDDVGHAPLRLLSFQATK